MFCQNCGAEIIENANICGSCGTPVQQQQPVQKVIPEENEPLSPWAYFGLHILFAVPVVGFIFLLIFTFNGSNINRRNFARSYWCAALVAAIICAFFIGMVLLLGFSLGDIVGEYSYMT